MGQTLGVITAMPLAAGRLLGPYEVLALIDSGGQAEVYSARDTRLARTVAIKVLPSYLTKNESRRQRLAREAQAISK